jgi:hypothetical protein
MNLPSHGHGHKKASPLDPITDSSSSTTTPTPVGTAQILLGSLLSTLQQVIGGTPAGLAATALAATAKAASSAAAGSAATAAPKINVMA